MKTIRTSKELGSALKNNEPEIRIEGDLCKQVMRIRGVKPTVWGIVAGSIAAGAALLMATPAVTVASAPAGGIVGAIPFTGSVTVAAGAATILGVNATIVALGVAIGAGGGTAVLVKMRNKYTATKISDNCVILKISN